jgi:two-component system, OmpR family, alkaline phosphatase synthesis response regulator PhoP
MMEHWAIDRILVVEDEPSLRVVLVDLLKDKGYVADSVDTGFDAKERIIKDSFDLVIMDVMLPDTDGFEVCRYVREQGISTSLLMLTARDQTSDKVRGLRIGADDYLTKPFDPEELLARIEALLRRRPEPGLKEYYDFGELKVNLKKGIVLRASERVQLSEREFTLLRYLIERSGQVVTRQQLLVDVWNYAPLVTTRTIDVHIGLLRRKLERDPKKPSLIVTVQNQGYRFLG